MKIGIIGVGNIGSIFVEQLKEDKEITLYLFDKHKDKTGPFEGKKRCDCADSAEEIARECDIIILSVKPQDSIPLLKGLKDFDFKHKIIISTITGISIARIREEINAKKVARIMPNVPSAIGKGVTGVCYSQGFDQAGKDAVNCILSKLGIVIEIEEKAFPAVTALSGSGPAFVFVVIESMIDIGLKMGLSYDVSRELVLGTLIGSAQLLEARGNHPGEFRHLVTSPAGTTIEGIYSLEREGLRGTIMKAINDTYERAKSISDEIERQTK
jgi:pyrroline-5-carboxylate reductase